MKKIHLLILLLVLQWAGCGNRKVAGGGHVANMSKPEIFNSEIRILSYNIHHANPPSKTGLIDIQAIARVITAQDPHLVALQEVDVYTSRSGKNLHQAEELGRLTGMKPFFAKAIDYDGGEYGLAMLSKFPLQNVQGTALPTAKGTGGEPRILMTATATLPGDKKIRFAVTHLDAQRSDTNRLLQMNMILGLLKGETLPLIIAGDFNAVPGSRVIALLDKEFTRTCILSCGYTIPVPIPEQTIDFIAYRPADSFGVKKHEVVDERYASDHFPVKAILSTVSTKK